MSGSPAYNKPQLQNLLKDIVASGCERGEDDQIIYGKMRALVYPITNQKENENTQDKESSMCTSAYQQKECEKIKEKDKCSSPVLLKKRELSDDADDDTKVTNKKRNFSGDDANDIKVTNKKAKRHEQIVKADNQNGKAAEKGNYNTNVFDLSALVSRAQRRAKEIVNQLPLEHERPIPLDTLLVVGGSEGSITGALATYENYSNGACAIAAVNAYFHYKVDFMPSFPNRRHSSVWLKDNARFLTHPLKPKISTCLTPIFWKIATEELFRRWKTLW
jgi:hypothetical protein